MKKSPQNPLLLAHQTKLDAMKQAQADKLRRVALSFDFVFDQPKLRNEHQKRVLEHLGECASMDGNDFEFMSPADGVKCIAAGIHRDGAKSILRIIHRQLANAATLKATRKN